MEHEQQRADAGDAPRRASAAAVERHLDDARARGYTTTPSRVALRVRPGGAR